MTSSLRERVLNKGRGVPGSGAVYDAQHGVYTDGHTTELASRADRLAWGATNGKKLKSGSVWVFNGNGQAVKL